MKILKSKLFSISVLLLSPAPWELSFGEGGDKAGQSPLTGLIPFVLLFALFYFLIIRPQQKRSRQRDKMLKELKRGDNVLTNGGIYATITDIGQDDTIALEIAKGVTVRASVSAVASKTEESPGKKAGS